MPGPGATSAGLLAFLVVLASLPHAGHTRLLAPPAHTGTSTSAHNFTTVVELDAEITRLVALKATLPDPADVGGQHASSSPTPRGGGGGDDVTGKVGDDDVPMIAYLFILRDNMYAPAPALTALARDQSLSGRQLLCSVSFFVSVSVSVSVCRLRHAWPRRGLITWCQQ